MEYQPDLVLVSAGFDIYHKDPLGGMAVTPRGFANLARIILEFARKTCDGKVVFVLEGGYHLEGLRDSAREVLRTMRGEALAAGRDKEIAKGADAKLIEPILKKVKETHRTKWRNL
jgi:acetoin utilization deacetylase AcuC-like enzyme